MIGDVTDCELDGFAVGEVSHGVNRYDQRRWRGGIIATFPQVLHAALMEIEHSHILSDVVNWNREGNAFLIKMPQEFTSIMLPAYFRTKKLSAFKRQLRAYGFVRRDAIVGTADLDEYHHAMFHRDHPENLMMMTRSGAAIISSYARDSAVAAPTRGNPGPRRVTVLQQQGHQSPAAAPPPEFPLVMRALTISSDRLSAMPLAAPVRSSNSQCNCPPDGFYPRPDQTPSDALIPVGGNTVRLESQYSSMDWQNDWNPRTSPGWHLWLQLTFMTFDSDAIQIDVPDV